MYNKESTKINDRQTIKEIATDYYIKLYQNFNNQNKSYDLKPDEMLKLYSKSTKSTQ